MTTSEVERFSIRARATGSAPVLARPPAQAAVASSRSVEGRRSFGMTSPRWQPSQWKHSLLILTALSASTGTVLHAQDTTTTAGAAIADTTRRSPDTTAAAGAPAQRPDT